MEESKMFSLEKVYRQMAEMSDNDFQAWAESISFARIGNESLNHLRKRVLTSLESIIEGAFKQVYEKPNVSAPKYRIPHVSDRPRTRTIATHPTIDESEVAVEFVNHGLTARLYIGGRNMGLFPILTLKNVARFIEVALEGAEADGD